jgi:hypothetical protein
VRRFISADQTAVVITGRVADLDASQLLPIVDSLNKALNAAQSKHPGYKISLTDLSVIAAKNSAAMIEKLNPGLMISCSSVPILHFLVCGNFTWNISHFSSR